MKKFFLIMAVALMAICAQAQVGVDSLTLGDYNKFLAEGEEPQAYQGSYFCRFPTTFYLKHTGSEVIYKKEELASMAGKEITSIKFVTYNLSAFSSYKRKINVWVKEIDDDEFGYDSEKKAYKFFDFMDAAHCVSDYVSEYDYLSIYGMSGEFEIPFNNPFVYSGEKNLLVVFTFDGEDCANGGLDINFFMIKDIRDRAMTFTEDHFSFMDFYESEDWPAAGLTTGTKLELPVTRFLFREPSVTAVPSVSNAAVNVNSGIYNLSGQKVDGNFKGIVVRNGKKIMQK